MTPEKEPEQNAKKGVQKQKTVVKEKKRNQSAHGSDLSSYDDEGGKKRKKYKENIEDADEETEKIAKASWAHKQGLPSKPGVLLNHAVQIQKHELDSINQMQMQDGKVNARVKTKGRF